MLPEPSALGEPAVEWRTFSAKPRRHHQTQHVASPEARARALKRRIDGRRQQAARDRAEKEGRLL
jgi:hypothetical protein